ncbi:MAG: deoxyribonuclease V [Planctomycetota bacterium]|jgi:deoxyribonuclease V
MKSTFPTGVEEARAEQRKGARKVRLKPIPGEVRRIAGCDCAFQGERIVAAVVVLAFPSLEVLEVEVVVRPIRMPYIPGLLSFREGPALLDAIRRLSGRPDLFLFDGQGIAHPTRLGIASHVGVILGRPSIGVAKSRLTGESREPGKARGASVPLMDGKERIGSVVRTREGVRPVFVSPGHLCDFDDAERWVLATCTRYRLPEPIRAADHRAKEAKGAWRG